VIKRDGSAELLNPEKLESRIAVFSEGLDVNPSMVSSKVLLGIFDGVKTTELDVLVAETAAWVLFYFLRYS